MNVVSRAEWRARPPKQPYTALAGSQGIAVHHAGDGLPAPVTLDQAAAKARSTQNYHMDSKGWNDIAYGWLVAAGRVFEGRGWGWIDGADTGAGRLMHSVCWLGDSTAHPVSDADLAAIASVIDEHQARYGADLPVVGHGQINATDCPGDRLEAWLAAGRPVSTPAPPASPNRTRPEDAMAKFTNPDGRDEFATIHPDGKVRVSWQSKPGSTFSDWAEPATNAPVALSLHAEVHGDTPWLTAMSAPWGVLMVTLRPPGKGWTPWVVLNDFLRLLSAGGTKAGS